MLRPTSFLLCVLMSLGQNGLGSEIIHGKIVPKNLMLYMASVQNAQGYRCGGFLISEEYVLTAAHCNKFNPSVVILGTHNLKKVRKDMRYDIAEKCVHPNYTDVAKGYDIMLLKLSRKAPLNNKQQLVQLPRTNTEIKDKVKCRVAGWGATKTNSGSVNVLKFTEVSTINHGLCQKQWDDSHVDLPKNIICAGGYGVEEGFCQGDSGGPLVCGGIAVGVVSFNMNENCDYPDAPNIYTDISKYLQWIKTILKRKTCSFY